MGGLEVIVLCTAVALSSALYTLAVYAFYSYLGKE